jgi:protein-S-isoprenylcysteine O-methyltransferase Ste14
MAKLIGKATISPVLFYSGKICGYILWILLALDILGISTLTGLESTVLRIIEYVLLLPGLAITALSLVNLGKSTTLGLPQKVTAFKTHGIYRFSRNPMYIGFNLITLAAVLHIGNPISSIMGVYSIVIYHVIILGEEAFLEKRFGAEYLEYKRKVRRYF